MARRFTLKEAFLSEEEGKLTTKSFGKHFPKDNQKLPVSDDEIEGAVSTLGKDDGNLSTKSFGKHFPKDNQKLPMTDKDIEGSISTLEKNEDRKIFSKPVDKSIFSLGELDPELQKDVPYEKSSEEPSVKQANKELSKFQSLLEDEMQENKGFDKQEPESPFDDAFKKHQEEEEKKEKLTTVDEPFSGLKEDCGCHAEPIDPATDGLSADVLSDEEEDMYGPTEFVVIKFGDEHEDGLNVRTSDKIEYGAPEGRKITEEEY